MNNIHKSRFGSSSKDSSKSGYRTAYCGDVVPNIDVINIWAKVSCSKCLQDKTIDSFHREYDIKMKGFNRMLAAVWELRLSIEKMTGFNGVKSIELDRISYSHLEREVLSLQKDGCFTIGLNSLTVFGITIKECPE